MMLKTQFSSKVDLSGFGTELFQLSLFTHGEVIVYVQELIPWTVYVIIFAVVSFLKILWVSPCEYFYFNIYGYL